jgi:hypothetical protein
MVCCVNVVFTSAFETSRLVRLSVNHFYIRLSCIRLRYP